ncbi:methionyl-tRNA synthetase [Marasmius crinis-equi]|uniref:methionine--tRNA ligase n=1 Tax=Marasmius crinis-equi TaxID=585013 RepID=A0ABR3F2H7_9AGAR
MLGRLNLLRGSCFRSFSTQATSASTKPKPWYTTTPIFYPNAAPHIGHLYSLVTADIFARYQRLKSPSTEVRFVTGTDEHGLKIQKAALAKQKDPRAFCDEISQHFRRLTEVADISHTTFIRTSEERHLNAVHHIWRELDAKNLIYKGSYSGWYSITDECFYTDSQVVEVPADATSPTPRMISKETGSTVEHSEETNYMFRLSEFQKPLLSHYQASPDAIYPGHYRDDIIRALESEPLEDISISRPRSRLSWGIPVPGDSEHTVYVWMDALISYLTGIGYPWKNGEQNVAWPVDVQVIGKDIVRFHAIYLPAILLALGLPIQNRILAHAHWTSSQKKMSKSLGNTTDPFQAIEEFGIDSVRYYLAKVGGRFVDDVDWSHDQLSKHDKELQSLLGNFFLRATSAKIRNPVIKAIEQGVDPFPEGIREDLPDSLKMWEPLRMSLVALPYKVMENLDNLRVAEALENIVETLRLANKGLTEAAPWSKDAGVMEITYSYGLSLLTLKTVGMLLQPFTPGVAGRLLDALMIEKGKRWVNGWDDEVLGDALPDEVLYMDPVRLFDAKPKAKLSV